MDIRAGKNEYKASLEQKKIADKEVIEEKVEDKEKKKTMKSALIAQIQKSQEVAESAAKSELSMDKKMLGNAAQFDGYIDDIVKQKRA